MTRRARNITGDPVTYLIDGNHGGDRADVQVVALSIVDEDRDVVTGQKVGHAGEVNGVVTGAIGHCRQIDDDGAIGRKVVLQPGHNLGAGLRLSGDPVAVGVDPRRERVDCAAQCARVGAGEGDDVIFQHASTGDVEIEPIGTGGELCLCLLCRAIGLIDRDGDRFAGRHPSKNPIPGRRAHHQ